MKLARSRTDIIFIDSINPLPPPGEFPQILNPSYTVTPVFRSDPAPSADPPRTFTIRLPVITTPTQIPKLASAGLAFSPYTRAADYSSTNPRTKLLWLEFELPPADPRDIYFTRVIRSVPDPLISHFAKVDSSSRPCHRRRIRPPHRARPGRRPRRSERYDAPYSLRPVSGALRPPFPHRRRFAGLIRLLGIRVPRRALQSPIKYRPRPIRAGTSRKQRPAPSTDSPMSCYTHSRHWDCRQRGARGILV